MSLGSREKLGLEVKGDSVKAFNKFLMVSLSVAGLLAFSAPAQAGAVIDFGTGLAGAGGTITSLGGGNYSGTAIPVGSMTVSGAGAFDGVYTTSGTATGSGAGGPFASLNFNTASNTLTISGSVPGLVGTSQTLLSGSFSSFGVTFPGGGVASFSASGPDVKSTELLRALGIPITTPFAYFGFSIAFGWNGTSGTVTSTDIINTAVPEPSSMMLLGTGLLGLGMVLRRRYRKG